jgi:hypothetical protein
MSTWADRLVMYSFALAQNFSLPPILWIPTLVIIFFPLKFHALIIFSGQCVKFLRDQYVSIPEKTTLVACFENGQLIGFAIATVWDYEDGEFLSGYYVCESFFMAGTLGGVGWITQLIVDAARRKRYYATQILQMLKGHPLFRNVNVVGLVTSHPAACAALAKYARKFILLFWCTLEI